MGRRKARIELDGPPVLGDRLLILVLSKQDGADQIMSPGDEWILLRPVSNNPSRYLQTFRDRSGTPRPVLSRMRIFDDLIQGIVQLLRRNVGRVAVFRQHLRHGYWHDRNSLLCESLPQKYDDYRESKKSS